MEKIMKCPTCGEDMPAFWKFHKACGWEREETKPAIKQPVLVPETHSVQPFKAMVPPEPDNAPFRTPAQIMGGVALKCAVKCLTDTETKEILALAEVFYNWIKERK